MLNWYQGRFDVDGKKEFEVVEPMLYTDYIKTYPQYIREIAISFLPYGFDNFCKLLEKYRDDVQCK